MRLLGLLSLLVLSCSPYKILIINPNFAQSHTNYLGSMADILVDAGHNVTTLIPVVDKNVRTGTKKSKTIYIQPTEEITKMNDVMQDESINFFEMKTFNVIGTIFVSRFLGDLYGKSCRNVLEHPGLVEELRNEKYDVVITENFDMCGLGLSHIIQPKTLIVSSTSVLYGILSEEAGAPRSLSYNPTMRIQPFDVHSMVSRFWNIVGEALSRIFFVRMRACIHDVFRELYGKDFPSWMVWIRVSKSELSSRAVYFFTNAEPLIDFAHPTLHRVIDLPGLAAIDPKPLDNYWMQILTRRPRTALISFGSINKSYRMRLEWKMSILEMVKSFHDQDITFIWKYEKLEDDFAKETSEVKHLVLSTWMPQNDLPNDPRVVIFLSHGGMGSTQEIAKRGVPTLFVPIGGDQPRNAAMMEHNGLGQVYDKFGIPDSAKLTAAFKEILEDESYIKRAKEMSKKLARKPFSSKEMLIKHVEFAAEFGASSALRPQSLNTNFIEYHNLDIIFVSLVLLGLTTALFGYIVVKCSSKYSSKKAKRDYFLSLMRICSRATKNYR